MSNYLSELKISSHDPLTKIKNRFFCMNCKKSCKFFCQNCEIFDTSLNGFHPLVSLPLSITIIKHSKELNTKSTAIHAKLLSPDNVNILSFSNTDDYLRGFNTIFEKDLCQSIVLYPAENALELSTVDFSSIKNIFFIDGTWSQAKAIHNSVFKNRCVSVTLSYLPTGGTLFWRHQTLGEHAMSTIEAIYFFFKEVFPETKSLDDLLWLYSFFYSMIQNYYNSKTELNFTKKHRHDYIKR